MTNKKMETFYYVLTSHSKIYEEVRFPSYEEALNAADNAIFKYGGTAEILKCVAVMACSPTITKCED